MDESSFGNFFLRKILLDINFMKLARIKLVLLSFYYLYKMYAHFFNAINIL